MLWLRLKAYISWTKDWIFSIWINLPFYAKMARGLHPLWGNDAFSPCFRFPPCCFLVINHKFRISLPIFAISIHFPSYFDKIILSHPTFINFPLFSANLRVFYILCVFRFTPYFYHDAFMHHTMHVLDAPEDDSSSDIKSVGCAVKWPFPPTLAISSLCGY